MTIRELPEETRLIQLAEECAEASQAALKLIRAMHGDTPVSEAEARTHLIEEIADIRVCASVILSDLDQVACDWIAQNKRRRWESRINA